MDRPKRTSKHMRRRMKRFLARPKRERPMPAVSRAQSSERRMRWLIASMFVVTAFLTVVRVVQNSEPMEVRLGVPAVVAETRGIKLVVDGQEATELHGQVVTALDDGNRTAFLVRRADGQYVAFSTRTLGGQPLRYDAATGLFTTRKAEPVGFDRNTGNSVTTGVQDQMRPLTVQVEGSEIGIIF